MCLPMVFLDILSDDILFPDRSSNISDGRFSSSQAALLKGWRNNVNSEFIEMNPAMWTSDITPSKTTPNNFSNHSHSDLCSKYNQKVYSPTIDTYLEPTVELSNQLDEEDSSQVSPQIPRKTSEDYVIYDHSRISSNNVDSTWPSSVHESSSDFNPNDNEENKRFSMISNNYYGQLGANVRCKYDPLSSDDPIQEANISGEDFRASNESLYERIDEDPVVSFYVRSRISDAWYHVFSLAPCRIYDHIVGSVPLFYILCARFSSCQMSFTFWVGIRMECQSLIRGNRWITVRRNCCVPSIYDMRCFFGDGWFDILSDTGETNNDQ